MPFPSHDITLTALHYVWAVWPFHSIWLCSYWDEYWRITNTKWKIEYKFENFNKHHQRTTGERRDTLLLIYYVQGMNNLLNWKQRLNKKKVFFFIFLTSLETACTRMERVFPTACPVSKNLTSFAQIYFSFVMSLALSRNTIQMENIMLILWFYWFWRDFF